MPMPSRRLHHNMKRQQNLIKLINNIIFHQLTNYMPSISLSANVWSEILPGIANDIPSKTVRYQFTNATIKTCSSFAIHKISLFYRIERDIPTERQSSELENNPTQHCRWQRETIEVEVISAKWSCFAACNIFRRLSRFSRIAE
jgi:hypothetical protein